MNFLALALMVLGQVQGTIQDKVIGKAAFEVLATGDTPIVRTTAPVTFSLHPLKPGAPIPKGYAICDVLSREDKVDESKGIIYVTTVLKCGEYEYGIQGVLFTMEKRDGVE